ncbi:MAG: uncharacterized protein KVP18_001197 [Porospora cf. gigantea A]|uniref:uncharacterized protein n=1 Tax=Porospora cf. gigantea A TaxID=2853593 RepID=UPI00355A4BDF|nr:MAG: hypothetical protein KVP18_001197 [Porospora cf. gigantea A]
MTADTPEQLPSGDTSVMGQLAMMASLLTQGSKPAKPSGHMKFDVPQPERYDPPTLPWGPTPGPRASDMSSEEAAKRFGVPKIDMSDPTLQKMLQGCSELEVSSDGSGVRGTWYDSSLVEAINAMNSVTEASRSTFNRVFTPLWDKQSADPPKVKPQLPVIREFDESHQPAARATIVSVEDTREVYEVPTSFLAHDM